MVEIEALRSGVLCESVALHCAPKRVRVGDVTSPPGENLPGTWERRGPDGATPHRTIEELGVCFRKRCQSLGQFPTAMTNTRQGRKQ